MAACGAETASLQTVETKFDQGVTVRAVSRDARAHLGSHQLSSHPAYSTLQGLGDSPEHCESPGPALKEGRVLYPACRCLPCALILMLEDAPAAHAEHNRGGRLGGFEGKLSASVVAFSQATGMHPFVL